MGWLVGRDRMSLAVGGLRCPKRNPRRHLGSILFGSGRRGSLGKGGGGGDEDGGKW